MAYLLLQGNAALNMAFVANLFGKMTPKKTKKLMKAKQSLRREESKVGRIFMAIKSPSMSRSPSKRQLNEEKEELERELTDLRRETEKLKLKLQQEKDYTKRVLDEKNKELEEERKKNQSQQNSLQSERENYVLKLSQLSNNNEGKADGTRVEGGNEALLREQVLHLVMIIMTVF
jgi:Fe2+ transport system protein B